MTETSADCSAATGPCQAIIIKVSDANNGSFSKNDVRQDVDGIYPPETYVNYLCRSDIQKAIGAQVHYTARSFDVIVNITSTGDCKCYSDRALGFR